MQSYPALPHIVMTLLIVGIYTQDNMDKRRITRNTPAHCGERNFQSLDTFEPAPSHTHEVINKEVCATSCILFETVSSCKNSIGMITIWIHISIFTNVIVFISIKHCLIVDVATRNFTNCNVVYCIIIQEKSHFRKQHWTLHVVE